MSRMMRYEGTLIAFEEDIQNKSIFEWIVAHTSGSRPLYRFEGILEVSEERKEIVFTGKDSKSDETIMLQISFDKVVGIYLGFDDVFRMRDERSPWNKPLVVKFNENGTVKTIYIFASFKRCLRTTQNKQLYRYLKRLLFNSAYSRFT